MNDREKQRIICEVLKIVLWEMLWAAEMSDYPSFNNICSAAGISEEVWMPIRDQLYEDFDKRLKEWEESE